MIKDGSADYLWLCCRNDLRAIICSSKHSSFFRNHTRETESIPIQMGTSSRRSSFYASDGICRYQLSYRDLEEMMKERGLTVDHSTIYRWVQRYAPEINRRIRPHLKMSGTSYRVDETYIKVGKSCKYLYRAVDKEGNTIEFILSAKCDVSAAKRRFKKMMRADHRRLPFSISVDENAAYPDAFISSQKEKILSPDCKLRRVKYLNNIIE